MDLSNLIKHAVAGGQIARVGQLHFLFIGVIEESSTGVSTTISGTTHLSTQTKEESQTSRRETAKWVEKKRYEEYLWTKK